MADDLRARSVDELRELLTQRADLLRPWPADLSQVARHAADDASVLEAMQLLTLRQLRLLEAAVALEDAATPEALASATQLGEALVREDLQRLWGLALMWGGRPDGDEPLLVVRAARQAYGPWPCGLGPAVAGIDGSVRALAEEPTAVLDAALDLPESLLQSLIWDSPVMEIAEGSEPDPVIVDCPLLLRRDNTWLLPRELSLILRGGVYFRRPLPDPPEGLAAEQAPGGGGHAALSLIAGVRHMLGHLRSAPVACRSSTGMSRRAAADLAESLGVTTDLVIMWAELAAAADLVGVVDGRLAPTARWAEWTAAGPERQWLELVHAWLDSDRPIEQCQPGDVGLGLLTSRSVPQASLFREQILQVWSSGGGYSREDLVDALAWHRPRLRRAVDLVDGVYSQAHDLGLAVGGIPTPAMAAVSSDPVSAGRAVGIPEPDNGLIVQPDLTVIAGLGVDRSTWELLQRIANVESWGAASVHRIAPAKVRAVVAGGTTAAELLEALRNRSRTPLPQALEYTITDAARLASPLTVHRAGCVVQCASDDAREDLQEIGLRELGPGIWIGEAVPEEVASALQTRGLAAAVAGTGASVVAEPFERPQGEARLSDAVAVRLIRDLQRAEAGTEPTAEAPDSETFLDVSPAALVELLGAEVARDGAVWLQVATDPAQAPETHLLEPLVVGHGSVSGFSVTSGRVVTLQLSQVARVAAARDGS